MRKGNIGLALSLKSYQHGFTFIKSASLWLCLALARLNNDWPQLCEPFNVIEGNKPENGMNSSIMNQVQIYSVQVTVCFKKNVFLAITNMDFYIFAN